MVFKHVLLYLSAILFVGLSGTIFLVNFFVLGFNKLGFGGFVISLWHVIVLTALALYIDFKRGKTLENWKYECKEVTSEMIDEYVALVKKKEKQESSKERL